LSEHPRSRIIACWPIRGKKYFNLPRRAKPLSGPRLGEERRFITVVIVTTLGNRR
jgi:hypothetical protein